MSKIEKIKTSADFDFRVIYSGRRTISISITPDSSVIIRVPFRTTDQTIEKIAREKAPWITRHRDRYLSQIKANPVKEYINGEKHLFRGNYSELRIERSAKSYVRFLDGTIELGLPRADDPEAVRELLYKGYREESGKLFPEILRTLLIQHEQHKFFPSALIMRTMKRRWGSCSSKGIITLNTELIKLPVQYTEYVMLHELCHLRHHNHGKGFYELLSELYPGWKKTRKELRSYVH